jgi:tetratricopeptide (TPR) repeat protein
MWSGSHGRLAAYNGFDVPVDVTVDGATERVEPYDTRWFSGLAANTTVHLAARVGDELLEERDASVTTADTVWNVAGRGVMAKVDVTYGQVEALPTTFYDTDDVAVVEADYVLATPPSTVETGEHEAGAHRSLVTDILRYGTPTPLEEIAGNYASEHPDAARAALGAELRVHPANVAAAMILAPMLAYDQAATLALWTRVRDAAPEDVQAHRAYQEATGMTPDVIAEYKARAEAAPTAVNLYLYGRLLGDDAASTPIYRQALAADPDFPRTHYALGRVAASEGEWATASAEFATYARLAPEGGEDVHRDQLWLARLLGGTADTPAVKALIGEDRYGINTAVWRLADAPERLAAEKLAVGERFAADPEVKDGPSLGLTSAELDLVAGDLVAAREAIAELAEKHPDVDTTFLSVLVELSDGGDHTELARLLATDPKVGSPYLMLLDAAAARALGVEGAAGRIDAVKAMFAGHHSSFPGVVDLRPDDDAGLRALIDHLEPEQRLYALHIAAWAAEGTGDMRRARARRLAARAVALPGVGPYVHP